MPFRLVKTQKYFSKVEKSEKKHAFSLSQNFEKTRKKSVKNSDLEGNARRCSPLSFD
jgi:hypothetical protein